MRPSQRTGLLTPADADEHPLAEFVGGVGEDDGGVEVTTFPKHPEEIGGVEVVEGRRDETAPNLRNTKVTGFVSSSDARSSRSSADNAHHVALVDLGAHGELNNEPGGVPQDEGGDQVPVDDVPQAPDAPARRKQSAVKEFQLTEEKLRKNMEKFFF